MNHTRTIKDTVNKLRRIAFKIEQKNINMLFPSLYPSDAEGGADATDELVQLKIIDEALDTIRRGGRLDASRVSALVHYIADMMQE